MIDVKDLRIGNWIFYNGYSIKENILVESIYYNGINVSSDCEGLITANDGEEYLEGIPLTQEILLKAGFERLIDETHIIEIIRYKLDCIYIEFFKDKIVWSGISLGGSSDLDDKRIEIKYVHSLQNIFYFLTNTELEINL